MTADLADLGDRDRVAERGVDADFLVNAAGIILLKPITEVTVEDWRRVQTINAEAIFFLCQKIGPRMQPGGAIVNLSSSSAKLASTIEVATYAASKTTILSITRSFAYALAARPVRVNAICPGIVDTPMQEAVLDKVAGMRGMTRGRTERGAQPDRAARPRRLARGMRRADLVPAVEGVRLHDRAGDQLYRRHGDVVSRQGRTAMKKPMTVCTTGLGHPEGPYELDDGRVIYANTYASEIGVYDPKTGKSGTFAFVGGGPNACMLGTDGCVYSTQTPNVGAWVAPEHRPPSIQKTHPDGKVEILVTEADGHEVPRPERPDLRPRRAACGSPIPATGTRPTSRIPAGIVCIEKDGTAHIVEELEYVYPNGIVAEPDGSIVWVESYTLRVVRRTPDGKKTVIHTLPEGHIPDGLKIDVDGNLWITDGRLRRRRHHRARTARRSTSSRPAAPSSTAASARAARSTSATWDRST